MREALRESFDSVTRRKRTDLQCHSKLQETTYREILNRSVQHVSYILIPIERFCGATNFRIHPGKSSRVETNLESRKFDSLSIDVLFEVSFWIIQFLSDTI